MVEATHPLARSSPPSRIQPSVGTRLLLHWLVPTGMWWLWDLATSRETPWQDELVLGASPSLGCCTQGVRRALGGPDPAGGLVLSLGKRQEDGSSGSWGCWRGHHRLALQGWAFPKPPWVGASCFMPRRDGAPRESAVVHQPPAGHLVTLVLPVANWSVETPTPPSQGCSGPCPTAGRVGTRCLDRDVLPCYVPLRLYTPAPWVRIPHVPQKRCSLGSVWFSLEPVGVLQSKHFRKACFECFALGFGCRAQLCSALSARVQNKKKVSDTQNSSVPPCHRQHRRCGCCDIKRSSRTGK